MYKKNSISAAFLKARHGKTLELLKDLSPKKILDVGCDDGHFLAMLEKQFPSAILYACDMEKETLDEARKVCPNARLSEGDFMKLAFEPVNLVVMLEVMEHAPDPDAMLQKAASLIGKNGHIILSIPRPELLRWGIIWSLWSNTLGRRWQGMHGKLTESELIAAASKCSLRLEKRARFFSDCISIMLFKPT